MLGRRRSEPGHFVLLSSDVNRKRVGPLMGWPPTFRAKDLLFTTVAKSLDYACERGATPPLERERRRAQAGWFLGVDMLVDRNVAELSPAERHRVELACGLLYAPPLLLVEEPNLPPQERVVRRYRLLQSQFGVATLWVCTDPEPLRELADRVV